MSTMATKPNDAAARTSTSFRIVLIGAGQIGAQAHLPAVLSAPGVELAAIVDPAIERGQSLARNYGLKVPVHARVANALVGADGAIVATPDHSHFEVASECIAAGIPVLIEKPMTTTLAEARQLAELATRCGVTVMVGYVTRFRRSVRLLRSLIDCGRFGAIRRFSYQYGTNGGWAPLSGYGGKRAQGQGVLAVTGSHFVDRMLWLWGYPESMSCHDDGDHGPEANTHVDLRFPGGMEGHILCSKTAALPGALVLDAEAGRVLIKDADAADIVLRPRSSPEFEFVVREGPTAIRSDDDTFVAQLLDFVSACRSGKASGCSLEEGVMSMQLFDDLFRERRPMRTDWYGMSNGESTP